MQNLALLLTAALAASTAAAQSPTPEAAGPVPKFATSDVLPDSLGFDDAYALYEIRIGGLAISEDQQVTRWQDELKAGRARAGALVGGYLAYRALTPADCAEARTALLRADELGSDQAAWGLAELAQNTSCGDPDRAQMAVWLKKAVTLDYFPAALRLIALYAPDEPNADPVQHYLYARVAGGYAEAITAKAANPPTRPGYDAAALQSMEKTLSEADRAKASAEAARILAQMLKRHDRFVHVQPAEAGRGGSGGKGGNEFVVSTIDYRHECQWNLAGNCRGAQRLAFVDLTSKSGEFLDCKIVLHARDFAGAPPNDLTREVLLGPKATRRLALGDVSDQPDKKATEVTCAPLADLAKNAAANKCRAKLNGSIDVENFYPQSARNNGIEGTAVVRYFVPPGGDAPIDAEIATSSGDVMLDDAALATIRSGKFTKDCVYGLNTIRIAFKLSN